MLVAFTRGGWPLLGSSRAGQREPEDDSAWNDLVGQRDTAYGGIKELEFEYSLGNLSERDYERLRQRYRSDAAATLRKLDAAVKGAGGAASGAPASAAARPSASPSGGPRCPSCDKPAEDGDHYCRRCGTDLGRRCGSCSESVGLGARFCTACGAP